MSIVLAMAWRITNRDIQRFKRLLPRIQDLYCGVSIVVPPDNTPEQVEEVSAIPNVKLLIARQGENRRYVTIQQALDFDQAAHVHYCDGDHVISRMERYLEDWTRTFHAIPSADCLIIGRSSAVYETYPRALQETEQIINLVGSHLLGQEVDLGSGARGFSRSAVEFLVKYASPRTYGVTADLEWVLLLHRAGFCIKTYLSEGAIYEISDEHQRQRLESVEQWSKRTEIACMIIQAGIDAASRNDLPDCAQSLYNNVITNNGWRSTQKE